jgi:hypothetical protein
MAASVSGWIVLVLLLLPLGYAGWRLSAPACSCVAVGRCIAQAGWRRGLSLVALDVLCVLLVCWIAAAGIVLGQSLFAAARSNEFF